MAWLALLLAASGSTATATAQARWALVETLRIESEVDGPHVFSDLRGIATGSSGSIFVLDFKAQEIWLFDAQGRFLKRVARRGAGPGEIANANGMQVAADGRIWVNDPNSARFSVFKPSGDFDTQYRATHWGYSYIWQARFDTSGDLLQFISVREPDATTSTAKLERVRPDGSVRDTLPLHHCPLRGAAPENTSFVGRGRGRTFYMGVPYLPTPIWSWDGRGSLWCSSSDRYELLQLGLVSGDTTRRLTAEWRPVPVSRTERDAAIEPIRKAYQEIGQPQPDYDRIPKVKPALENIDVDNTGRLWVRRTTTDTAHTVFDIWDPTGRQLATATAPWRISQYHRPVLRGDTLYAVITDENDVPAVVRAVLRK